MTKPETFITPQGRTIAYHKTEGSEPTVIFLGGFRSDMTGSKALALESFCKEKGQAFIRFDYSGHGQSSGKFEEGTIGQWAEDAMAVIDKLGSEQNILVGSSMGGWLMLLAALEKPEKVAALIGIASAPDFTEHLLLDSFSEEQREELKTNGVVQVPNCYDDEPYPITLELIAESGNHLVLDDVIDIRCPVHLIHGLQDEDVPWEFSVTLNEKLRTKDVKTTLVDDGDHRMSSEKHIGIILKTLDRMLTKISDSQNDENNGQNPIKTVAAQ